MGKMKGDIYKYYMLKYDANDPSNSSPKLPKWECRFCSKQYVQNATKMRHHVLNMCEEIPAPLKLALLDIPNVSFSGGNNDHQDSTEEDLNNSSPFDVTITTATTAEGSGSSSSSKIIGNGCKNSMKLLLPSKKRKIMTLNLPQSSSSSHKLSQFASSFNSIGINPAGDKEYLWVLFARAIYASGAPLDMLDNPFWVDVIQRIAPGINLPPAQLVSKDLLDKEEGKINAEVEKHVQDAQYVGVQCESWFNKRGDSMTTFVVTTPSPFSYKTNRTGSGEHNSHLIAEKAVECIQSIQSSGSKVLSFVSSTADHMKPTWSRIHESYPDVITFGCAVEALESLFEDVLNHKDISEILHIAKTVVNKLKRSPVSLEKFNQIQVQINEKVRRVHPLSPFKPISYLVCLQSLLNLQNALKWLAMDEDTVQIVGHELAILVSDEFWTKVDLTIKILFPIIKWLHRIREVKPEISLISRAYVEISSALDGLQSSVWQSDLYPTLKLKLQDRLASVLENVHLAANLLDPREQGGCLDQEQILQATEFIDNFAENHDLDSGSIIAELSQFRMKTEFYAKPFLWKVTEKVRGAVWWTTMAPKTHLAKLAAAILNIHPATFKMDRNFTDTFFQGSHNDSAEHKLIYVAHNLRISTTLSVAPVDSKRSKFSDSIEGHDAKHLNGLIVLDRDYIENLCNISDSGSDSEDDEEETQLDELVVEIENDNHPPHQDLPTQTEVQKVVT